MGLSVSLRYFEITLVGQEQDETTGLPGFPGLWIFGKI